MFLSCDMTGLYRSADTGAHWTLLDQRDVQGSTRFSVAFDPARPNHVLGFHPVFGLRESTAGGEQGSWTPYAPPLWPAGGPPLTVTAAGFSPDGSLLLVGTTGGLYRLDLSVTPPAWQPVASGTRPGGGGVAIGDVVGFVFPSQSPEDCFLADIDHVYWSIDRGASWTVIDGNLPARPAGGPYVPDLAPNDAGYTASRIRGFDGADNPQATALFVSVLTDVTQPTFDGGVFRLELTAASSPANPPNWAPVMGVGGSGLNTAAGTNGFARLPMYEFLAVSESDPDTVYVSVINSLDVDLDMCWAVYKGRYNAPQPGQITWAGVYDGFHTATHPSNNVGAGWIDEREGAQGGLGWGFGGPGRGLDVSAQSTQRCVFVNNAFVDVTDDGAQTWSERYTQATLPSPSGAETWQSEGLEITTTWRYVRHVDPAKRHIHFLCCTDIGLARSETSGETWTTITPPDPQTQSLWNNVYDLAFDAAGSTMWAAVSNQHDIPHEQQLNEASRPIGTGDVLVSVDDGATWSPFGRTGLAQGPVVSLVFQPPAAGAPNGVLYASVWGSGVFRCTIPAPGTAPAWQPVGTLVTGGAHPHSVRIALDAAGTLYCVAAADTTGGAFVPGGLYRITSPMTQGGGTPWEKVSGGLEELLRQATAPGQPNQLLAAAEFVFDPTSANLVYLAAEDVAGSHGGGGLYRFDASAFVPNPAANSTNGWSDVGVPFRSTQYHDSLQAFSLAFVSDVMFATSTSHGMWWRTTAGPVWREYVVPTFLRIQRLADTIDRVTGIIDPATGDASLYLTTFGGGAWQVKRECYFIRDHSTVSRSEVEAQNPTGVQPALVQQVAFLVLDGFLGAEVGITSASPLPAVTVKDAAGVPVPGITATCRDLQADAPADLENTAQRFTAMCDLRFDDSAAFPQTAADPAVTVFLHFDHGAYVAQAPVRLIFPPHPYMLDGATPWLSEDIAVFRVVEGTTPWAGVSLGVSTNDGDVRNKATAYIQSLLMQLNGTQGQVYDDIALLQSDLQIWPRGNGGQTTPRVLNFALARVRYRATTAANDVRVFFRLCTYPATGLIYDDTGNNRPSPVGPQPTTPLLGFAPRPQQAQQYDIVSVPCFATLRTDTNAATSTLSMRDQDDPPNVRTIPAAPNAEVVSYFGCWLDLNQPQTEEQRFARNPAVATPDGPWQPPLVSLADLILGRHQCLLAEVHFFDGTADAIVNGDTPGASDCLSQRNLTILGSDNPGNRASHTVQHPLEIKARSAQGAGAATDDGEGKRGASIDRPDQLLIWWRDLPTDCRATLFLPDIEADDVMALDAPRREQARFERLDRHTLRLTVGGLTYLPLPPLDQNAAALLTVELPDDVRYGQEFTPLVQQMLGPTREIIGTVQISIVVRKPKAILRDEENTLAVMRYREKLLPIGHRWKPVLQRYSRQLAEHVGGLGGHPGSIGPSPYGAPEKGRKGCLSSLVGLLGVVAVVRGIVQVTRRRRREPH